MDGKETAEQNGSGTEGKQDNGESFSSRKGELSSSASESERIPKTYKGVVYHIGVNRLGHHYCHQRFLRIRGSHIEMFKKDPDSRNAKPIRQGVAGKFLKFEDAGRRQIDDKVLYVIRISNSVDGMIKGEIGCETAFDASSWREAFLYAKEAGIYSRSGHKLVDDTNEFKLTGHRPRVRRYARDLTNLIMIGSDNLLGKGTKCSQILGSDVYNSEDSDSKDERQWNCVRLVNGIRILEDVSAYMAEKLVILKAVGVIEASSNVIFEMLMDTKNAHRKGWDVLNGDLTLIEAVDGHCDLWHGTFDLKYLRWRNRKQDFVFSRTWRHDPDNSYSIILESPPKSNFPKKSGFQRIKLNPTIWEIKPLPFNRSGNSRSLVTQTMEIRKTGWGRWRRMNYAKLDKTIPYVILCQVAGLRDYFASNSIPDTTRSKDNGKQVKVVTEYMESMGSSDGTIEEFYDALAAEDPEEEEEEDDEGEGDHEVAKLKKPASHKFKATTLALMALTPRAIAEANELVSGANCVDINLNQFKGSLPQAITVKDSSCWMDPGGSEFMVRGQSYLKDYMKISGGKPLLKLLAVDWLQSENKIDLIATNRNYLVQSEAAKKLPFILAINLQVPADPNYSLIFYFGADRPIKKGSLLDRFVNGSDAFRDSRFKLIPRIVEGYWLVKRAVGTKACILGKAVTCSYLRHENFLEIDVDIGSSSVARAIINLVLGHITSLVVDMAVLIEGANESELPEYLLGTTRAIRVKLDDATPYIDNMT